MAKLHGCTLQTVRNALRGFVESELADRIRAEALRAGGIEKPKRRVIKETVSETE
jgi:hypothetical protein